ncbi:MAG: hypothetical protein LBB29_01550 [Holosporaceae bacterium]|nr:hypothetical protein [Holosporaceae bacterium]
MKKYAKLLLFLTVGGSVMTVECLIPTPDLSDSSSMSTSGSFTSRSDLSDSSSTATIGCRTPSPDLLDSSSTATIGCRTPSPDLLDSSSTAIAEILIPPLNLSDNELFRSKYLLCEIAKISDEEFWKLLSISSATITSLLREYLDLTNASAEYFRQLLFRQWKHISSNEENEMMCALICKVDQACSLRDIFASVGDLIFKYRHRQALRFFSSYLYTKAIKNVADPEDIIFAPVFLAIKEGSRVD